MGDFFALEGSYAQCTGFEAITCNPARPLTGVSRALRARNPERVSKESPALGSKKFPKQSRNSLRSLKIDCFETPETVLRLFRTLLGPRTRKAPGDSFETLSGFRARETPVRGGRGCKPSPSGDQSCDPRQSEIAATNFYDSGGRIGRRIGRNFCAFSCFICCPERPTNLLPKSSSQFITPCLVAEIL